jgi:hypothetical protein
MIEMESKELNVSRVEPTDSVLEKCAKLFSENYGIWSEKGAKPGKRVVITKEGLRKNYLFNFERCFLITASIKDELIGHAFVCRFPYMTGSKLLIHLMTIIRYSFMDNAACRKEKLEEQRHC